MNTITNHCHFDADDPVVDGDLLLVCFELLSFLFSLGLRLEVILYTSFLNHKTNIERIYAVFLRNEKKVVIFFFYGGKCSRI
jgi:hypothetical protein